MSDKDITVTELPIDIDSVNQIHHAADIHIRNVSRHDEYREVFNRFYDIIGEHKTSNDIIYVGGDIAHSKNDLSPELVDLASEFLYSLSQILPTIVIPGNHDHLASNPNRLDAISPIINNLVGTEDLFYLKQSGIWTVGDTAFVHMSQYDNPEDYISADDLEGDYENVVALYHGTVDKSMTDTGYAVDSEVSLEMFEGYDMSLLGDIHRPQYMDLSETVAFSGSLIQQNHGEDLGHGFLLWDVPERNAEFMEVPNDYGYYTLDVRRGRVPLDENAPRKVRLRLRVEDTSVAELNRVTSDIRQFYNVQELRYDRQNSGTASPMESDESDVNIGDIRSVSYQSKLIEKYLDRERDLDEDMIGRVKKLNKDINNKIENEDLKRNVQWRLKRFEWDNMFSYGEGNEIEFENMEGIVGLFAENASGKSSLLDAITFCLFDKCSRAYKSTDILNNQSEWFRCKATFELDGTEYVIERTAEFESDGRLPVDVDFYKKVAGEKVSLNGERRSKTNQKIRKYIGEYEDFISTAFSMQGSEEPMFVEKSNARRKDMLNRFIGIDVFDRLHSKAKDEIRDVKAMMNTYENRDLTTEYADAEDRLSEAKSRFNKLKNKKADLESRRSDLKDELLDYHKELVDIPEKDLDIDSLRSQRDKLESKLESVREDRKSFEIKEREKKQPLRGFKDIIESVDEDSLEQDKSDFVELKNKLRDARNMLQNITGDIEETQSEIKHLESHEFDPDCEYCVQRNEKDADKLESLRSQLSDLEDKRERYEEIVPELESKVDKKSQGKTPVEKWEKYQDMKSKAESTKTEIRKFKMKAQEKQVEENRVENQLKDVRSDIELYNKIQDDIEHNKSIRSDMKPVKKELKSLNSKINRIEDDIQDCFSEIKVAERDKKEAKEDLEEYQRLSEETEAYNLYLEATKRDGVPYDIVEDIMPQIEQEVNEILSQIVPFGLMMHLDGKNIDAHIIYDETRYWPVELASGMEKFVSNLAIRVALTNISNMPRPNFLAIDEGFGVLDQSNLNSLSLLFDYLKTQYKFCVIISHLEVMRDMVNDHIEIESDENGKSHVSYL